MSGSDLDGDGDQELIFSSPGYDSLALNAGCVFIFNGGGIFTNLAELAVDHSIFAFGGGAAICSPVSGDYLGWGSPPVLADFDADGLIDLAIAAPGRDRVYVFSDAGQLDGIVDPEIAADAIISAASAPDWFGYSLVAGDFNGNGYDDLAIGAPGIYNPIENAQGDGLLFNPTGFQGTAPPISPGKVYLFEGQSIFTAQAESDASSLIEGNAVDLFGMVLNTGDLSGDGFPELIVGSPRYAGNQGRITIYSGSP
jgi:hypothetical protein